MRELEGVLQRALEGPVREQEPLCPGGLVRLERLLGAEVAARAAFRVRREQRRLADEQVGIVGDRGKAVARPGVARVADHGAVGRRPKTEGEQLVVQDAVGRDREAGGLKGLPVCVLVQLEGFLEHLLLPETTSDRGEHLLTFRRHPELRHLRALARSHRRPPDPRDEVAPVVEVPVRDRYRVHRGPALALAQAREDAWAAVEQQSSGPFEQVAGLRAAGVRPGRRAADDLQIHAHILDSMLAKIRVVIAKPGLDGHDRGAKIIARALRDAGMEVIYTGLHQTPEQIVETVIQEDADAVGLSILSGAHMTLVPRVLELLHEQGVDDVVVTVGGTIPGDDADELRKQGVAAVFTPGAPTSEVAAVQRETVPAW